MGPSPSRPGRPIGSAGPTTATRMDKYAPILMDLGQKAMIGKGKRSQEVIDSIVVIDCQGNNLYEEVTKEFCALQ